MFLGTQRFYVDSLGLTETDAWQINASTEKLRIRQMIPSVTLIGQQVLRQEESWIVLVIHSMTCINIGSIGFYLKIKLLA